MGHFDVSVWMEEPSAAPLAAALVAVRGTGAPEERERDAPDKGYLLRADAPGTPTLLTRDLFQIGSAVQADLRIAGPRRSP